jgi:hypothetical protein
MQIQLLVVMQLLAIYIVTNLWKHLLGHQKSIAHFIVLLK